MIRKQDAVIGARVKWQSLDGSVPPAYGSIVKVTDRQAFIRCDFPDPDTDTFLDSGASCWNLA
jgi:hypothetical protein